MLYFEVRLAPIGYKDTHRMENVVKAHVKRIKEASDNNRLVIFVGAGVSKNSGVPTWPELIDSFREELPDSVRENKEDLLKTAQLYQNSRRFKECLEKVRLELKYQKVKFNDLHKAIFQLNPAHVITTNYDDLLEQAASHAHLPYVPIAQDGDLPYATYERYIIKMHGDLQVGNIVLTEDDYLTYKDKFPLIRTYVQSLFASKLVLFVGFSFDDINLKFITNEVMNHLKQDHQQSYLLHNWNTDALYEDYYRGKGLQTVSVKDVLKLGDATELSKTTLTHKKGVDLHQALKKIQNFEPFKELHSDKHIIDVLYDSIEYYFTELESVGAKRIEEFYPFNSKPSETFYRQTVFTSNSAALHNLAESLKSNFTAKRKFLKKYSHQHHKILKFARSNGIYWFKNTYRQHDPPLCIRNKSPKESGLDLLFDLDFKELLEYMERLQDMSRSDLDMDDLELPYLYYKIGEFHKAHKLFSDLAEVCWKEQKHILYFICQHNRENIRPFPLDKEPKEYNSPAKINFQKILFQIQKRSPVIYEKLLGVHNYEPVYQLVYESTSLSEKIKKNRQIVEKGGGSINDLPHRLTDDVFQLFLFTNNNCIVSEHYSEHRLAYQKAFEGAIISHSTQVEKKSSDRRSSKLQKLSAIHLLSVILDVEPTEVQRIFDEHEITHLELEKGTKTRLKKMAINGINSWPDALNYSEAVANTLKKALQNVLLLLSKVNMSQDWNSKFLKHIAETHEITFFEIEKELYTYIRSSVNDFHYKALASVLGAHIKQYAKNVRKPFRDSLTPLLIRRIRHDKPQYVLEEQEVLELLISPLLLNRGEGGCWPLIALHQIAPKKVQKTIQHQIQEALVANFDPWTFYAAKHFRVPVDTSFDQVFLHSFEGVNGLNVNKGNYAMILTEIYHYTENDDLKEQIDQLSKQEILLDLLIHPTVFSRVDSLDAKWLLYFDSELWSPYLDKSRLNDIDNRLKALAQNELVKQKVKELLPKSRQDPSLLKLYLKHLS